LDGIFRSTLYRLRRAVFRESVLYDDGIYYFDRGTDYWYDTESFVNLLHNAEQATTLEKKSHLLQEALQLYQGHYLEGIYADWCVLEREQLRELQLNAREDLAELHARSGRLQQAIGEYQLLVNEDPYREPAHRELMRCHFRLGDRVSAIRQYQTCVEILREDLGLSPAPETEELYLQIIG
jgi:DNA-binding SARP family transcriptional activator